MNTPGTQVLVDKVAEKSKASVSGRLPPANNMDRPKNTAIVRRKKTSDRLRDWPLVSRLLVPVLSLLPGLGQTQVFATNLKGRILFANDRMSALAEGQNLRNLLTHSNEKTPPASERHSSFDFFA